MDLSTRLRLPCGSVLKNRIGKSALSEAMGKPGVNEPNEGHFVLYQKWAVETGAGLLITGNIQVDETFLENTRNLVLSNEARLECWKKLAESGQVNGVQLWGQINHPGRQCPIAVTGIFGKDSQPLCPSAVGRVAAILPVFRKPRALKIEEIKAIVSKFARTASLLKKAGFSGVQIHAAHGYLISQFLSPLTNKRTDEYGGSIENRMRFLVDIIRAVRLAVGPSFPIGVKLNSADYQRGGFDATDSLATVEMLISESIDLLEISGGTYERAAMFEDKKSNRTLEREAYFLEFAERIRETVSSIPLMLTGGFRSAKAMNSAIKEGKVDVVGIGRPFALTPDKIACLFTNNEAWLENARLATGIKDLDGVVQIAWHQQQMRRLGNGQLTKKTMSRLWSMTGRTMELYLWDPFSTPHLTAFLSSSIVVSLCVLLYSLRMKMENG